MTRSQKNVYGGTLMTLKATLGWCANGSNVQSATWNYSTSTSFGWSFDKWQLPPTVYFNYPSNTPATAVGQAKFCLAWCASSSYIGTRINGFANGSSSWDAL